MKYAFLLPFALLFTACSKADTPVLPPSPSVSYTDGAGKTSTLNSYRTTLTLGAPLPSGAEMRIITLHVELPDASQADLLYFYQGNSFPKATGQVSLYSNVYVAQYAPGASPGTYYGAAPGTLTVDAVSPNLVSGSYTGPLQAGGPTVQVRFQRLLAQ